MSVMDVTEGTAGGYKEVICEVQGENASLSGRAAQLDFATKQARQFATDCKSQAGSAVLPAGAGVGLLECLEDDSLFFRRNPDTRVGNFKGHD